MAPAIGQANMKWFGFPATGQGIIGFTAITSAGKTAGIIGTVIMTDMISRKTAVMTETTIATTTATKSGDNAAYRTPAYGPAFWFVEPLFAIRLPAVALAEAGHSPFVTLPAYRCTPENCYNPSTPSRPAGHAGRCVSP